MQLFVAFFLGFCFLIFCTFPFAVITRLKLVLLRLLVLVFLSCNIIYIFFFHFGCIACALCRHHIIVVIIIMETLGFVNLATAAVRGFLAMTHLALNCNKKKLLNWPSNKEGGYEKLLGLISCCCCCCTWHCLWLVAHTTSGLATSLFGSVCCLAISVYWLVKDATHSLNCHSLCLCVCACCSLICRT